MKRLATLLLLWVVRLAAVLAAPGALLGGAPTVLIGTSAGVPGETAEVAVHLTDASGTVGLQIDLLYDFSRLTPTLADRGAALGDHIVGSSIPQIGVWRLLVYSTNNSGLGSGNLLRLRFEIAPGALAGLTPLIPTGVLLGQPDAVARPAELVPGAVQVTQPSPLFCLGDVGLDGLRDLTDSVRLLRHIVGQEPLTGVRFEAGDVNGDERVNVQDAVLLSRHILGLEPLPECPPG